MDVLVTYDISTSTPSGIKRLALVAKICEGYGSRVQYSVFECRLSPTNLARFVGELTEAIDPGHDSVRVYRFNGSIADARTSLGLELHHETGRHWIL
jgi:CRISPR-associated protein Cas2